VSRQQQADVRGRSWYANRCAAGFVNFNLSYQVFSGGGGFAWPRTTMRRQGPSNCRMSIPIVHAFRRRQRGGSSRRSAILQHERGLQLLRYPSICSTATRERRSESCRRFAPCRSSHRGRESATSLSVIRINYAALRWSDSNNIGGAAVAIQRPTRMTFRSKVSSRRIPRRDNRCPHRILFKRCAYNRVDALDQPMHSSRRFRNVGCRVASGRSD